VNADSVLLNRNPEPAVFETNTSPAPASDAREISPIIEPCLAKSANEKASANGGGSCPPSKLLSVSKALFCCFDIHAVQAKEIFAQYFSLGLLGDLWIAALLNDVVGQLEFPKFLKRPSRMPDWGFSTKDDFVFAGPPHEFAHDLGKDTWLTRDKIHGGGNGCIKIWEAHNLPERFVKPG
jgi:hypothetical protein